jgi:hypothetical protein
MQRCLGYHHGGGGLRSRLLPLLLSVLLCLLLSTTTTVDAVATTASTAASTTTTADGDILVVGEEEVLGSANVVCNDGWCVQAGQFMPINVVYCLSAGAVLALMTAVRRNRRCVFIILLWFGTFAMFIMSQDVLTYYVVVTLDLVIYYYMFRNVEQKEFSPDKVVVQANSGGADDDSDSD